MMYTLFIGDQLFSSWSMRGWLMLKKFGLPFNTQMVGLYSGSMSQDMTAVAPAQLVPVLKTQAGEVIGESLAIAETLAERHPDKAFWPDDPVLRARARWLCAEMVGGFSALRGECPMQLAHVNAGFSPSSAVKNDLARLEQIWSSAWALTETENEWLLGSFSLADVFYAPVAARIVGYDLPVSDDARRYCDTWLADADFKDWRASGLQKTYDPFPYPKFEPIRPWPAK